MSYTIKTLFGQFLCFIGLAFFFTQCDCNNPNKGINKPDLKKAHGIAPGHSGNRNSNSSQPDPTTEEPDIVPPLSKLSWTDIRVIEEVVRIKSGGRSKFFVDMLRTLKEDSRQVDMDSRDDKQDGEAILHGAVKYYLRKSDQKDLIKDLIKLGAKINAQDNNGKTPLHTAIQKGEEEAIQILLDQGASVDVADNNGKTPLHMAIQSSVPEIIQQVIGKATQDQVNAPNKNGQAPLHIAVLNGNLVAVQALLQQGSKFDVFTPDGKNALHLAAARGYVDIFKALLGAGADVNVRTQDNRTIRELTQSRDIIRLLGGVVPPVEQVQDELFDSLPTEGEHPLLVKVLVDLNAGININVTDPDENGTTALQQAAVIGNLKAVKILLDHGADTDLPDNDGKTALHQAVQGDHLEVVQVLLARGASVNAQDGYGQTPLFRAIGMAGEKGKSDIVKELVDNGADVNVKTDRDTIPLFLAAEKGNMPILEYLLNKKANVNAKNNAGMTPVYIAAVTGNEKAVRALISHGADVNLSMNVMADKTPLGVASAGGYLEIVKILLQAGAKVQQTDINVAHTEEIKKLLETHMLKKEE